MPFSGVCASYDCHAGTKTTDECVNCHHAVMIEPAEWTATHKDTVNESGPNGCVEICHTTPECQQCHTTGVRPDFTEVGPGGSTSVIEAEHVKQDWMEAHGGYALDDDSVCFDCHVGVGQCEKCHEDRPDSHGLESTWLNRHAEQAEGERNELGCLTCHDPEWCDDCHNEFKEMR